MRRGTLGSLRLGPFAASSQQHNCKGRFCSLQKKCPQALNQSILVGVHFTLKHLLELLSALA